MFSERALPSGLKLESKSKIFLTGNDVESGFSEKEELLDYNSNRTVKLQLLIELQKKMGC